MYFSTTAAALLAIPGASAQLNQLAKAAGKLYFGSATDNGELTDAAYVAILEDANMFGQITPGNGQKWEYTEPSQGQFDYTSGDQIVDFAESNGQIVRCHTLAWYSQLPSWVGDGTWTVDTLTSVLNTHIANEVGHYKGQCRSWDVVNEALNEDGTYRENVFYTVIGESYIPLAFEATAAADPDAKLYYNDYNIEGTGAKQDGAVTIINLVKDAGAKIDGVGMQAHLIVGTIPTQSDLETSINSYLSAGVTEVAYTELDIRFSSLPPDDAGLQQQATDYGTVTQACLAVDACVGITIWDYTDKYSWIPGVFAGSGAALPWDENLSEKPAYSTISSVLAAAATGSASNATITTTLVTSTLITATSVPTSTSGS
ncbi:Uu.00g079200.m01.CDS01 [Anthostomella pinea]|uniref:Beta-xylanase n=1 Tax=Anthostomella pinea TaxID=933095 RepID=A0AAI8YGT3_9PEZI|nr:Uu.00g079200.m01.CDS01 [Anthostomella pinea]